MSLDILKRIALNDGDEDSRKNIFSEHNAMPGQRMPCVDQAI